jgi:uncharacterized damage-inducible protein DinB
MIDTAFCKYFARYNRWQNQSLLTACAKLTDDTRKRNMGAFFKSIHATLNHLLVGDVLWLSRFGGEPHQISALDQLLYDNFDEFKQQRAWADDRIDRFVMSLTDARIAEPLTFRRLGGDKGVLTLPLAICIMQMFNHQTHHRGQLTTLLMQCGVDPGVTDLPMLPHDFASPVLGV